MQPIALSELYLMLPELIIVGAGIILLMLGAFRGNKATPAVIIGVLLALLSAAYTAMIMPANTAVLMGGMFLTNGFTIFAKIILLIAAIITLIVSRSWLEKAGENRFEYPVLILFSVVGMMVMISANDLMSLYMGLELSSLALYVLASFARDTHKSAEAGVKYFVLGALASGMMLFGSSLVYGFAGTTNFAGLATLFESGAFITPGFTIGLVLLIIGFCFKISAVPFHMWTPDVYEGAPTPVTAFFAAVPKIAAIALLVRVLMEPFAALTDQWQQVIIFASIASMFVGALGAMTQTNIKRLLAYSSIGHVGYALVGLATAASAGVQGILIYLTLYIFMSIGAFTCVLLMQRNGKYVEDISELAGMAQSRPRLALVLAAFMFSMAGIPPLAGFFGKFYIFLSAIDAGLVYLAVLGVLSSVIAAFYYLKIVKILYLDEPKEAFDANRPLSMQYVLALCAGVTLLYFLMPTSLVELAAEAASVFN